MPPNTDGVLYLLILLGPLFILQRSLHRETQAIFLLLTRRTELAIILFSLLFFPGILLHESSHYLTARLLGVRTGKFSLVPRVQPGGRLQLGYVETASSDWLRDALIGAAPAPGRWIGGGVYWPISFRAAGYLGAFAGGKCASGFFCHTHAVSPT